MKIIQIAIWIISLGCCSLISAQAQINENDHVNERPYLQGLSKASERDLRKNEIMFDGESIPVYNIEGERIRGMKMMRTMNTGNYAPDFYVDKNREIKAIVLRMATADEKKGMGEVLADKDDALDELIGKEAIPFSARGIDGTEYTLEDLKGKIVVINFWFVECKPCIMEMPELNQLVEKYRDEEIVFLGFAMNRKSRIESFLKKKAFAYHIIAKSKQIAIDYGVRSFPTHIVVDSNTKIVYATAGLGPTTIDDIENAITSLTRK